MNPRYLFRKAGGIAALCMMLLAAPVFPGAVVAASALVAPAADVVHVVRRGDTLSAIARRYGTTVQTLMNYNSLRTTTIYVGQRILIPGSQPDPTYPITYVVQRGDTLAKIAARYDTTVQALMQVNNLHSTIIYVGQRLTISVAADPSAPMIEYIVQRGDTLNKLAQRFDVTVQAIMATNGLRTTTIYVGQRLLIPQSLGYPTPTPPVGRQRIQFAAGATSATVTGTVTDPVHREYVLAAQAGQVMRVELTSDHDLANFSVQGLTDGQILKSFGDTTWNGVLPATQDYLITILTVEFSSTNYSLFVEILPQQGGGTTERIQFAPGAFAATVSNFTSAIEPRRYLLNARAGQTMTVALNVDNANAYITVRNPNGDNLAGSDGPIHNWSGVLPANGDYVIEVLNPGTGLANFSLTASIQ